MKTQFSIGEFSKITGLTVKTLRFYHEKGLLAPTSVDEASGYRFYDESKVDKARVIVRLRAMDFSLEEIATMLERCDDEAGVLDFLERQKDTLSERIRRDRRIVRALEGIIAVEKETKALIAKATFAIEEKSLEPLLVAGVRMRGKYCDCGDGFSKLCRAFGRYMAGKPLCLYYDCEYHEEDADFEPCVPLRKEVAVDGFAVRTLPGARSLALVHKGPYDTLGRSYGRLLSHARENQVEVTLPTREVYLKGPGMIFRGNPKNYLTEIQLPLGA
ncbi:MAG: MerR family transcriptional regulator [Verrucomicrobia bacterium]|nr:MerR family transcriptional regulator [Verrucomicrobiota bacterium]